MGNAPSAVPFGAQLNLINIALACHPASSTSPTSEIAFKISLTAPLSGGSGQQIYYSDIYPEITLPSFQNSSQYTANVTIDFLLDNASPSSLQISGPASIARGESAAGLTAGPVTLGQAGIQHNYALGEVDISIISSTTGETTDYTCPAPSHAAIIGSAVVDSSTGPARAPSTGSRNGLPPTPLGSKATVANIPLSCGQDSSRDFNLTISGVSPVILAAGQTFNITGLTNFVTIPPAIVAQLNGFYGGEQTIDGFELGIDENLQRSGTGYGLSTMNASPQNYDIAWEFTASDANDTPTPLGGSRKVENANPNPVIVGLPLDGVLNIGAFTAGPASSTFSANITQLAGQLGSYSVTYRAPLGPLAFACTATFGNQLFSAPIA